MFVSKIKYDSFSRFIFRFKRVFERVSYYFIEKCKNDKLKLRILRYVRAYLATISFEIFLLSFKAFNIKPGNIFYNS